jgi:hypothetical protein
MNHYNVIRRDAEFKIVYMDNETAERWHNAGWEILSQHDSNENAHLAMAEWEAGHFISPSLPLELNLLASRVLGDRCHGKTRA